MALTLNIFASQPFRNIRVQRLVRPIVEFISSSLRLMSAPPTINSPATAQKIRFFSKYSPIMLTLILLTVIYYIWEINFCIWSLFISLSFYLYLQCARICFTIYIYVNFFHEPERSYKPCETKMSHDVHIVILNSKSALFLYFHLILCLRVLLSQYEFYNFTICVFISYLNTCYKLKTSII